MSKLRLWLRRLRWDFHWRSEHALKAKLAIVGVTPRPPDEHYRGERAPELRERFQRLVDAYVAEATKLQELTDRMTAEVFAESGCSARELLGYQVDPDSNASGGFMSVPTREGKG